MEFAANRPAQQPAAPGQPARPSKKANKMRRLASSFVLIGLILIAGALAYWINDKQKKETDFLKTDKYQAVFLNGGQVYFGKVRELNSKFLTMDSIYYLRVNEQVQPDQSEETTEAQQDISLAKLGCELHGPEDEMVINREQVTFWENLKDDGQVAKAIAEFVRQNPDGQKCAEPAAS